MVWLKVQPLLNENAEMLISISDLNWDIVFLMESFLAIHHQRAPPSFTRLYHGSGGEVVGFCIIYRNGVFINPHMIHHVSAFDGW